MTAASVNLTDYHYGILAALGRGENPPIFPLARKKLRRLELIMPAAPPRAPRYKPGRLRAPPPRRHRLTDDGRKALAAWLARNASDPAGPSTREERPHG